MLSIAEVKESIIAYLKANVTITSKLTDGADEIRELQWQGTRFTYPNVRVRVRELQPFQECGYSLMAGSIYVFSEDASSKEADEIAGIIANVLHATYFSSAGVANSLWITELVPSVRQDERTWRAEVMIAGRVV